MLFLRAVDRLLGDASAFGGFLGEALIAAAWACRSISYARNGNSCSVFCLLLRLPSSAPGSARPGRRPARMRISTAEPAPLLDLGAWWVQTGGQNNDKEVTP